MTKDSSGSKRDLTRRAVFSGSLALAGAAAIARPNLSLASTAAPGIDVAKKTVRVGAFAPITGPVPFYAIINRASDAYFQELNASGGIQGWKVEYVVRDDGYEPARSVAVTQRLIEEDQVFALVASNGTAQNVAVIPVAKQHNLPIVGPSGGSPKLVAEPNIFPLLPDYALSAAACTEYSVDVLKKDKIALLWENDELGRAAKRGIDLYLSSLNKQTVVDASFNVRSTDFSAQVRRAAEANAEVTIIFGSNANLASALRAANAIGYKCDWFAPFFTADPSTYGLAKDLLNGVRFSSWLMPVDADNENVRRYREAIVKHYPKDPMGVFGLNGWTQASLFAAAFDRLVSSGNPITREGLIDALNGMSNVSVGASKNVTFSKDDHRGTRQETMIQAQDGKFRVVRDFTPYPSVVFNAKP
ncbi:MAG TPA: ABC transporter substrate-binding protein [Bosea sp. (in: a-proteobacteria)]|jgi:ABC-type branched-subunit amino acid transport system substrate-binding protein|uniref:ABC transporter substrate-binding protein n=1 Tax=Bosea sp. (in: a-proteobacteria) TaxID=1871050 RepID=UPI002E0E5D54|nr:ABC transporter substrate-binding protein [Bosea sp. (in: a-proteobacteria)]